MRIKNPLSLISQPKIFLYCILVGSLIWVFNELNNRSNVTIFYPINFEYDNPENLVLIDPIPDVVEISINGTGWNLLKNLLKINIREAEYKLNNPAQTKHLLSSSLIPNISESLEDIDLNYVVTDSIFFNIELKKNKSLKIKLDHSSIKLRDNFKVVSDISISDDSINIEGPESLIDNLPDEYLIKIEDKIINRDFDSDILIESFDDFSEITPTSVNVSFFVSEFVNDEIILELKYDQNEYNIDTTVIVTYQIEKGEELGERDSLYLSYELINDSIIPEVVGPTKIKIIDLRPNSIKLDR